MRRYEPPPRQATRRARLSILYLRCAQRFRPRLHPPAQELSILYLRCEPSEAPLFVTRRFRTFNSLFEMHQHHHDHLRHRGWFSLSILYLRCLNLGGLQVHLGLSADAFNSLFEMPLRHCHPARAADRLSILYLRCPIDYAVSETAAETLSILYLRCHIRRV